MRKSLFALAVISTNALAGQFSDYVNAVKAERPYEKKRIENLAHLTEDMVIHYEKAVVLGTTADYEESTKIRHFASFLDASDKMCNDIDLAGCIYDLVCNDQVIHNLNTEMMPCQ